MPVSQTTTPSKSTSSHNLIRLLALSAFSFTLIFVISTSLFSSSSSDHDEVATTTPDRSSSSKIGKTTKQEERETAERYHQQQEAQQNHHHIQPVSVSLSSSSSPISSSISSSSFDPSLRAKFRNDIRTNEVFMGTAVSYSDLMFNNFSTFCNHGPGTVRCSSGRRSSSSRRNNTNNTYSSGKESTNNSSSTNNQHFLVTSKTSSCSCSWTPLARSCTGPFNHTNAALMRRVMFAHYVHSPTSRQIPNRKMLGQIACPWFDQGQWSLPDNFLDMNFHEAAKASLKASSVTFTREDIEFEKRQRRNIGPLLVWKLGRAMRSLKNHTTVVKAKEQEDGGEPPQKSKTKFHSPGMLIIGGDSMIRQLFMRLIQSVRSKESKTENEMFRGGVFERYYHLSAGYVVTTKGDALELDFEGGCERVAREAHESTLVQGGGKVLLRVCYVWDPKKDFSVPSSAAEDKINTDFVINRLAKLTSIAGVIYWPTIHGCTTETGDCADADVSNAAAFRIYSTAIKNHVPRVVVSSSVMRHWYPFYFWDLMKHRNSQLKSYFPVNIFEKVRQVLDEEGILSHWRRSRHRREKWVEVYDDLMKQHHSGKQKNLVNFTKASAKDNVKDFYFIPDVVGAGDSDEDGTSSSKNNNNKLPPPEPIENTLYFSSANGKFRFYDHGARHKSVAPRQCDHGHSMCMFFPQRTHPGKSRYAVNGMSGICPNGSRCEDPWNFLFIHELLALLIA